MMNKALVITISTEDGDVKKVLRCDSSWHGAWSAVHQYAKAFNNGGGWSGSPDFYEMGADAIESILSDKLPIEED
jgi:hypothetical protein